MSSHRTVVDWMGAPFETLVDLNHLMGVDLLGLGGRGANVPGVGARATYEYS